MGRGPNSGGGDKARVLRRAKRDEEREATAQCGRGETGMRSLHAREFAQVDDVAVSATMAALGGAVHGSVDVRTPTRPPRVGAGTSSSDDDTRRATKSTRPNRSGSVLVPEGSRTSKGGIMTIGVPVLPFQLLDPTARALAAYGVDVVTATSAASRWGPGLVQSFVGIFTDRGLMEPTTTTSGADVDEVRELREEEGEAFICGLSSNVAPFHSLPIDRLAGAYSNCSGSPGGHVHRRISCRGWGSPLDSQHWAITTRQRLCRCANVVSPFV